jgi:hypothetical protein
VPEAEEHGRRKGERPEATAPGGERGEATCTRAHPAISHEREGREHGLEREQSRCETGQEAMRWAMAPEEAWQPHPAQRAVEHGDDEGNEGESEQVPEQEPEEETTIAHEWGHA